MRAISKWFLRELKLLDPDLKVRYNPDLNYFEVTKVVNAYLPKKGGGYAHIQRELIRAVYDHLNDEALTNIRYRQYLGRKHNAKGDPNAYMKLIMEENKAAKAKESRRAREMIAEGARRMYMVGRQKYYT